MNISLNFNFNNTLNSIKTAFQSLSSQQQKIISIVTIILASVSVISIAYRYCFKAKLNLSHNGLAHIVPKTMVEVFEKHHYDPSKLPVLDMTPFGGSTDYIQYIKPKNMTSPIMQFEDAWGRNGIALHIQGKNTSTREWRLGCCDLAVPVSKIDAVWTFHQRSVTDPFFWVGGISDLMIEGVINKRHNETDHGGNQCALCPHCPIIRNGLMSASLLENLLTGKDPDFQLGATPNFNLFA